MCMCIGGGRGWLSKMALLFIYLPTLAKSLPPSSRSDGMERITLYIRAALRHRSGIFGLVDKKE